MNPETKIQLIPYGRSLIFFYIIIIVSTIIITIIIILINLFLQSVVNLLMVCPVSYEPFFSPYLW